MEANNLVNKAIKPVLSTAWVNASSSELEFELENCLTVQAQLGVFTKERPLKVLMMWGYDKLSEKYLNHLALHNIDVVDFASQYTEIKDRYKKGISELPKLGPWPQYEVNCLIRWLVLESHGVEIFYHIDLDLFINVSLEDLDGAINDKSGTFGSPCFTFFDSLEKFKLLLVHIKYFLNNPEEYSEKYKTRVPYRDYIGSDQDLFGIVSKETGELTEYDPNDNSKYSIFVNPLFIPPPSNLGKDIRVSGHEGFLNDKKVLFWHLQRNFVNYYADNMVLESFRGSWEEKYLPCRRTLPFLLINPCAETFAFHALRALSVRAVLDDLKRSNTQIDQLINYKYYNNAHFYLRYFVALELVITRQSHHVFSADSWHSNQ